MRIVGASFGEAIRIDPEGNGDVWTATWADDGNPYSAADDALGFGDECRSHLAVFDSRVTSRRSCAGRW